MKQEKTCIIAPLNLSGELEAAAGQTETHFGSVISHLARHAPCNIYIVRTKNK